ncbi:MAG TPA: ABC transporter substrate-binding protein [Gaiellaceae bacterium]|nr:ABC transporter substrate-binding protein [Gaiellaceae bacterium]
MLIAILAMVVGLAGCGGGGGSGAEQGTGASQGTPTKGGILRVGTENYIDSLNPFNYIESQAYQGMLMIFPQLVQYATGADGLVIEGDWAESWDTSPDGKDWTFHLKPGGTWSDGKPLTAADAAWTINTTLKYASGPTAVAAAALTHVKNAEAPDDNTLVIHYEAPVGNVLPQLEQFFILPEHVWAPLAGGNGRGLKTYHPEQHLPIVSAGAYTIKQYEKKGTTVFIPWEGYYGEASNAEAVALTYFTNADSMISELQQGNLDWVDQVPFNAVKVLEQDDSIVVNKVPGAETTNITWNSNPRKPQNRELLDPQVKKALSMCVDRERIIEVVFNGYASLVESLPGHITGEMENPNLGPLEHNCDEGNKMLDDLGYTRGSDGTRVAPATTGQYAEAAHPMEYEVILPTSTDFNVNRSFEIVQDGFAEAGVKLTPKIGGDTAAAYALETDEDCDAEKSTGYATFDMAMWDWVGYVDPDFMLSVVTKGQWCSWSDTGYDNPDYDAMYKKQGTLVDPAARKDLVWQMQQVIYDDFVYTQLTNHEYIDAHRDNWAGIETDLNAYSKKYWTSPYMVE